VLSRGRGFVAKAREHRAEAARLKLGSEKFKEKEQKKGEKRDYQVEYKILKAKEREELQRKVADALWVPDDSGRRWQRPDGSYSYRG
jgi:hypothetical protein